MTKTFDARQVKEDVILWIRDWFDRNGPGCNAVVGISGGKDSSVVAALCVQALGRARVVGVLMPNGTQTDISDSHTLCDFLGIRKIVLPVTDGVAGVMDALTVAGLEPTRDARVNLPPRIRMASLYAVAQCLNGRVANTCNLSEDWVGYSTRYGDSAGDFCPLAHLTVSEVRAIGRLCGLPASLVEKTPSDGLSGKSDEDNLGFTYAVLDSYIRTGVCDDPDVRQRIDQLHQKNAFKLAMPESFLPYAQDIEMMPEDD